MTQTTQAAASSNLLRKPMRIVLAGGTGHVGAILLRHFLAQGHSVTVLSRRRGSRASVGDDQGAGEGKVVWWDGLNLGAWVNELNRADVLINLAGRSVDCRYTAVHRWEIMESRVQSTRVLGEAIHKLSDPPRVWLNASTATIYSHALEREMDELTGEVGGEEPDVPRSWRFSIEVAKRWEEAFWSPAAPQTRKVAMRSAIVMNADHGSAFDVLLRLVRHGLGGTIGDGRQYVSWIHELDYIQAIEHVIARESFSGPVNFASPHPLPNAEFMRAMRSAWGTRIGLPASTWMLEIGTFLMRTESELVLKSRRVVPRRLLEDGFSFQFADWAEAARDLVQRWRKNRGERPGEAIRTVQQGARLHERTN